MNRRKVACMLVLVVFLTGMLPVTTAQTPKENEKELIEKYKKARAEYIASVEAYKNARQDYRTALSKYRASKTAEDKVVALEKAKTFLLKADIAMIRYLRMLRAKVESTGAISEAEKSAIFADIDAYIAWLEQKQGDIEGAKTGKELRETAGKIRDTWMDIRVDAKRIIGEILFAKSNAVIARAEVLADKVEAKIPELQAKGRDTAELERWLLDFRAKIELAKQKNEAAKEKFKEIKSLKDADKLFRQGHAFIKEANLYLREAYKDLKEIIKAFKAAGGKIEVSGTGRLSAQGDGRAYIEGNGTVKVHALTGIMIVSSNAVVDINGTGNKTVLGDGRIKYQGSGSAVASGEDITVELSGSGIDLVAEGTGTAVLAGNGTYSVCGRKCLEGAEDERRGSWSEAGVAISIATAEVG